MPAETGPVYLLTVLSLRSESGRVGSRDGCIHGLGGRVTGSDAEGPVTMPEGTGVGADHQQSPPKNLVYGLAAGFGHGGTTWLELAGQSARPSAHWQSGRRGRRGRPLGGGASSTHPRARTWALTRMNPSHKTAPTNLDRKLFFWSHVDPHTRAPDSGHTHKVPQLNKQGAPHGPWGRWAGWWAGLWQVGSG